MGFGVYGLGFRVGLKGYLGFEILGLGLPTRMAIRDISVSHEKRTTWTRTWKTNRTLGNVEGVNMFELGRFIAQHGVLGVAFRA